MKKVVAFDVYGTMINPEGVLKVLKKFVPHQADDVMQLWRSKQLEYTFRRGLMRKYVNFGQCTQEALNFSLRTYEVVLDAGQKEEILDSYASLPAFDDVKAALKELNKMGLTCVAFSNGQAHSVEQLIKNAGLEPYLAEIISVEDVKSFKPDPAVYAYLSEKCKTDPQNIWLVSGNSFDILGAAAAGLRTIWLQRNPNQILDPWEWHPSDIIKTLTDLPNLHQFL